MKATHAHRAPPPIPSRPAPASPAQVCAAWRFGPIGDAPNVHRFDIDLQHTGREFVALLQSDVHWDHPHCQRGTFEKHLRAAKRLGAPVLDAGDFFCAMQGKFDKRHTKAGVRPEHATNAYYDTMVDSAAGALAPYRDILTLRGYGNHETSVQKRNEIDLVARLRERLRHDGAPHACTGGFSGFVVFQVHSAGTQKRSLKMYYHHGYGGGGPVTRGVIQTARQAVYLADADIVWNGHTHDAWQVPIQRVRLNNALKIERCRQMHVRTAGYKDDWADGSGGWEIERGGPPKPIGSRLAAHPPHHKQRPNLRRHHLRNPRGHLNGPGGMKKTTTMNHRPK